MQEALGSTLLIKEQSPASISQRALHPCVRLEAVRPSDRAICKVFLYSAVTLIIEPAPLREATATANKHIIA